MKHYTGEDAIKIITRCAKEYDANLAHKMFLFIYRDKKGIYNKYEVLFKPKHFLHLTGNENQKRVSAVHFYKKCIGGKLSVNDIKSNDMTDRKLYILPQLMNIHKNARMIGFSDGLTGCKIITERFIGNVTGCLGFKYDESDGCNVPITALYADVRDVTYQNNQVIAVYQKTGNALTYNIICYIAKNSDIAKKSINDIVWPYDINILINNDNLVYQ